MALLVQWLTASQQFFQQLGWFGVLAFAALIVVLQLFLVPLAPVAIASGLIFGFGRGLVAVTLGTYAGAAINFLISRHAARAFVAKRIEHHDKFRLIDAAIGREGWKIIALLRFCPIPFGFGNYAYGITAIPFWSYFVATIFAIIPGNVLFTWLGYNAHLGIEAALGTNRPRHPAEYVLLVAGLLAGVAAIVYIGRIARSAMAERNLPVTDV